MEQLCSCWMDFDEIWYLRLFWKFVEKIQVSWKSAKNNRYFAWRLFIVICHRILFKMRNVSDERVEKIKTHSLHSITFFFWKLCCWWDIVEKCGGASHATDGNIICCVHFVCWITHTHARMHSRREYVTLIAFLFQQWFCICASVLHYMHIDCLFQTVVLWLSCCTVLWHGVFKQKISTLNPCGLPESLMIIDDGASGNSFLCFPPR
jgi:hypothetical protein